MSPAAPASAPAPLVPAPAQPDAQAPTPVAPPAPVPAPAQAEQPAPDEATAIFVPEPDATTDPLDQAAASFDSRRARSGGRREARSASRARRREEKASRRAAPAEALVARLPAINPLLAAIITGALSGLAAVGLAFGAARGCEAVRGTDTCGGGLGLLAIVAILAIEVMIGANLLKAWQISDPFSTSFLGVGIVATIAMLTFLSHLDSPWMLLVIPVMTAVAFALSWWVTVRFIDEYEPGVRPAEHEDETVE